MGNGYTVDPAELRTHAGNLEALRNRFDAIKSASAYITQDDEAYGTLCGWIAGCLEERHQDHEELVDYLAENLDIAARAVRSCADDYEAGDEDSKGSFDELDGRLG
ncbi:type VII secretion target [Glycomyces arizonensis]|uniref:type VII secretion target n=1 Tax=Glycomyces arizonensis TaxID=256035 RepID=UPI0003FBB896|nr:type VII secretion target [Glycomyces arizonensis]